MNENYLYIWKVIWKENVFTCFISVNAWGAVEYVQQIFLTETKEEDIKKNKAYPFLLEEI